ncbi:MAG: ABC transporter ATP-binding protein [Candidatus Zixiibacteriota bacterium]|nr:MAG: ABC transporter ATP-binding protein [candidate division Zixibacteria bacterium]
MIEIKGLKKKFGDNQTLCGIDLTVDSDIIFAIVGPDGAGKTTLLRILAGIMRPDDGLINILGHDIVKNPESAKRYTGYLSQRFSLNPTLTVAENIDFFGTLYEVPKSRKEDRLKRLLEFSRLGPFKDRQAGKLSGGMKQKLALCCALIHTPRILLLDEPTTGVDPISRRELWEILYDLLAQGVMILVSTPYMDEAERAGEIMMLHRGKTLARGNLEDLKSKFHHKLYEMVCDDGRKAFEIIVGQLGDDRVVFFGDRLHLALDSEQQMLTLKTFIADAGLKINSLDQISPGLEDIFMQELLYAK